MPGNGCGRLRMMPPSPVPSLRGPVNTAVSQLPQQSRGSPCPRASRKTSSPSLPSPPPSHAGCPLVSDRHPHPLRPPPSAPCGRRKWSAQRRVLECPETGSSGPTRRIAPHPAPSSSGVRRRQRSRPGVCGRSCCSTARPSAVHASKRKALGSAESRALRGGARAAAGRAGPARRALHHQRGSPAITASIRGIRWSRAAAEIRDCRHPPGRSARNSPFMVRAVGCGGRSA